MTHPNFENMLECTFCGSLADEVWIQIYPKTGQVVHCEKCWKEHGQK